MNSHQRRKHRRLSKKWTFGKIKNASPQHGLSVEDFASSFAFKPRPHQVALVKALTAGFVAKVRPNAASLNRSPSTTMIDINSPISHEVGLQGYCSKDGLEITSFNIIAPENEFKTTKNDASF